MVMQKINKVMQKQTQGGSFCLSIRDLYPNPFNTAKNTLFLKQILLGVDDITKIHQLPRYTVENVSANKLHCHLNMALPAQ